jgi:choice-of-anchor B domain-containing protein
MKQFRILSALAVLIALSGHLYAQTTLNTSLLGHLTYSEDLSEVRGTYYHGKEYALVGVHNGFSIVDVTDPTDPTQVFFQLGPSSTWRDPFYFNDHAYCVTEGGGGMLIVDISPLPGSTNLSTSLYTGSNMPWSSAHNMFIDTVAEKAYIFGTDHGNGGAIILSLADPENPVEIGIWDDHYIHDGFVRGDTLWAACLEAGVFVVDVSTPSSPVVLANWDTPSEFAHNVWPSDDNGHCYTTDEVNSGYVAGYDMSNLQNVVESDKTRHPLTEGVIPHNTHFMNDYLITSHYRDGMTIHDVSDPENIVLTGYYDSSPFSGGGFNGSWGVWPYLPSGNILISDIEEGLFVVGPTYTRAARLQGTVSDAGSGALLNDVQVEVVGAGLTENTDLFGDYATGTEAAGTYSVTFQKGGYLPQTVTGVQLVNGQTEVLDVLLVADTPFQLSGTVTEAGTGNPIEGAVVELVNEFFDIELTTDASGHYTSPTFYAGNYEVSVGAWGYHNQCLTLNASANTPAPNFELAPGYYDDFSLDLGWGVVGGASTGVWVRDYPNGTDFNGTPANPSEDVSGDCGGQAFVTGNAVGAVNIDDVDDGMTILRSPVMDLSSYTHAFMRFKYWFFNQGGNTTPNDEMVLKVSQGNTVTTLASLATTNDQWTEFSVPLHDFITLSDDVGLRLEIQDAPPGHLVEGGLDDFEIVDATGIDEVSSAVQATIFPNPAHEFSTILMNGNFSKAEFRILDAMGREVAAIKRLTLGVNQIELPTSSGVYLCEITIDGSRQVQRLAVQ